MPIGPFPHITLLEARKKREAAKDLLPEGRDPLAQRGAEQEAEQELEGTVFAAFADLYLERLRLAGRSAATIKKARWIVEDLAKDLRAQQVSDIKPRDVLNALRAVEAKGNREAARRMRGVQRGAVRSVRLVPYQRPASEQEARIDARGATPEKARE